MPLKLSNRIIYLNMSLNKCAYCQEFTPHAINEYVVLESCNWEPLLSESDYESDDDESYDSDFIDDTDYVS